MKFWDIEPILLFRIPFTPYFVSTFIADSKRWFVLCIKEWENGRYRNKWIGNI